MTPEEAKRRIIDLESHPPTPEGVAEWVRLHAIGFPEMFELNPGSSESSYAYLQVQVRRLIRLVREIPLAGAERTMALWPEIGETIDEIELLLGTED